MKPIKLATLMISLALCCGCARPPASPAMSPSATPTLPAMATTKDPEVEKFLASLASIKGNLHDKVAAPFNQADAISHKLIGAPLADRPGQITLVKKLRQDALTQLAPLHKQLEELSAPTSCQKVKADYLASLDDLKKEMDLSDEWLDFYAQEKHKENPRFIEVEKQLKAVNAKRNLETSNYQDDIKKLLKVGG